MNRSLWLALQPPWQGAHYDGHRVTAYSLGWYGAASLPCTLEAAFSDGAAIGVIKARAGGQWAATVLKTSSLLESIARAPELLTWGRFQAPPKELYKALGLC